MAGEYLEDGFATTISFAEDPTVLFKEIDVKPPGIDGGDAIPKSTMRNTLYKTKAARTLVEITDANVTVGWNPDTYPEIMGLVNTNTLITFTFPDGSTYAAWGFLRSFEPGTMSEGERPTADIVICFTNENDSGTETAPVETPAS